MASLYGVFYQPAAGEVRQSDQAWDISWGWDTSAYGPLESQTLSFRAYGAPTWIDIAVAPALRVFTAAAGTFTPGGWEARIVGRDSFGNTGQANVVFLTSTASTAPTITVPAGSSITAPTQTLTWTTSPAATQDFYQVQILDAGSVVIYDSGEVPSPVQTVTIPFPDTGVSRTIRVRIRRSPNYSWSPWTTKAVTVTHTPPVTPTVATLVPTDVGTLGCLHALVATITQPTPGGGVPAATTTEIYLRVSGDTSNGMRVAVLTGPATAYTWTAPSSGKTYEMRARNVAADGRSAYSAWKTASGANSIVGVVLYAITTPTTPRLFRFNGDGVSEDKAPAAATIQYDGRALPVVEFGTSAVRVLNVPELKVKTETDRANLDALVMGRTLVLYRDKRGRKAYGLLEVGGVDDTFYGYDTSLTVTAADYPPDRVI